MSRRFPQPVRVGHLIGAEVVTDDRKVLGKVSRVVRTREGRIELIVEFSRWFGWFARSIAVPIERVGSLGQQIGSIDMEEKDYVNAPTWISGQDQPLGEDTIILIALAKR